MNCIVHTVLAGKVKVGEFPVFPSGAAEGAMTKAKWEVELQKAWVIWVTA